jgi:hypothetical protein
MNTSSTKGTTIRATASNRRNGGQPKPPPASSKLEPNQNGKAAEAGREKFLDQRPKVQLSGDGRLTSEVATELGQILAPYNVYKYQDEAHIGDEGSKTLNPIKPAKFRTWIEEYVIPIKMQDGGEVVQSMTSSEAGTVLVSNQFLSQLREVERVNGVRLPVMRPDGKVELLPEGYDRSSKILTFTSAISYATDLPIDEARAFLNKLFAEFPFSDPERSKAVSIAAMVTLFGLDLMPPKTITPVFMYRGNLPGLGKGLLAQAAMIPVLGHAPTGVKPEDETEMRKQLFAVAKAGGPVVFIDNATGRFASSSLESFATTSTVTGRVLGSSTTLNCPKNCVVFITGNNCTLNADMSRRTLVAELCLAGDPGERDIQNYLDENKLLELRPQILAALYALVRGWAEAGKPEPSRLNPNFKVWSQVIGAVVEHAGFGPIPTSSTAPALADPREADMVKLIDLMYEIRKTEAVKFTELVSLIQKHNLFGDILKPGADPAKQENTALGRFFSSQDQRIFNNGLRFVIIGKGHARRYAVQRISPEGGEPVAAA